MMIPNIRKNNPNVPKAPTSIYLLGELTLQNTQKTARGVNHEYYIISIP